MHIKKTHTKKLLLALITNLNPKITTLSEQQEVEINQALEESSKSNNPGIVLSFQDFAGIKNLTISFVLGGVFILLKDVSDYDIYAKSKKKSSTQEVYDRVEREQKVNDMTTSAQKITMGSPGETPSGSPRCMSSESSVDSSPESSSSNIKPIQTNTLRFFLFPSKSQSNLNIKQNELSTFRERCAILCKQLTSVQKDFLPLLIIASSVDEEAANSMCDQSLLSTMGDVDLSYLKAFIKRYSDQNRIKQLYERITLVPINVTESNIEEYSKTYFVIKMKTDISFAAAVITSTQLQTLLNDFDEKFCIKLAEEICVQRAQSEKLLRIICDAGQWDNVYFQHSRTIIIHLIYNLIEKHRFIPDFLLNENLLWLYIEDEFSSLKSLIRRCSLQNTMAEMLLNLIHKNRVLVRSLSDGERSYRMSSLISDFVDAGNFVQAMMTHFDECTEAIAVVFSKTGLIGYRKAVERLITKSDREECIKKLKAWFTYDVLTSDITIKRAFCAGNELVNEHQRKASNVNYLFLTQSSVKRNFDMAAGTARARIKHKFVPVHQELVQLFEQTFLPHVEECLTNLCEIRARYNKTMIYRLATYDTEACNPENYQLIHFPKEMLQYFEKTHKIKHAELLTKMQSIYKERIEFEQKYMQSISNMEVDQYESISNMAKTILRTKVPVEKTQQVTNLDEFVGKIKLILDEILKNIQGNLSEIISQYPFETNNELYIHNDLYSNILENLLTATNVSNGKIIILNERELKNKLGTIIQEAIAIKLGLTQLSSRQKLS